jgi:hypothetical protein
VNSIDDTVIELRQRGNNLQSECIELEGKILALQDLAESAWGVIANAYGGDWELAQNPDWKPAAERWREEYHSSLNSRNRTEIDLCTN